MFKQIESVPNFPLIEKEIIEYWSQINVVEALKKERLNSGAPERVYYDGPITANGMPHYGHAITWTMKDVIPRHWSMQGNLVYRNMGWDCQGIPVEYEVEKELKFEKKEDIEEFGVAKFNDLCRQSVLKYRQAMFDYETKMGRWFDETQSYSTMDANYIESMWWSLKELYSKGLLYEGHKVVAYSTRAGTTLSTHEVNDGGYKEIEDPFVTVKFKLDSHDTVRLATSLQMVLGGHVYFLAWTTTPWTIPGNLMLSVGKNIKYSLVEFENDIYVLATERVEAIFEGKVFTVLKNDLDAGLLIGLSYEPPFRHFESKRMEGCFKVVEAPHTNTEEGTGIVHLAPYGAEDFEVFMNLGITLFDYLDETAHFTDLVPEYSGQFYKKANQNITDDLEKKMRLFGSGKLLHRMPMCWRTGTPLIFKPVKSWYVAVTKVKAQMSEENQKINWSPQHLKDGNSGIWINNARDWALSRNRYWGTPLPVWVNDKTGEKIIIGSFSELKELSGVELSDPHKPFVDEITWEDIKNGGTFRRVKDVIDVWYDSAAMPFAQYHYPFENKEKFEKSFPAEYISEGLDQVRLWFYVMHVLGVALFEKVPYQTAVCIGTLLNEDGKKMSKSKRNYRPMDEVLTEFGGDVLRYFVLSSPLMNGVDSVFSDKYLAESRKEFFLPLWNSLKYFLTYADIHKFNPTLQEPKLDKDSANYSLDLWILARLKELRLIVKNGLNTYSFMEAGRAFQPFVSDLSTWYIRRSRDRLKDGEVQALKVSFYVFTEFIKTLAPFLPFLSEKMFEVIGLRELTDKPSVHMTTYSEIVPLGDEETHLLQSMATTRNYVSLALALRVTEGIKVRQPLESLVIVSEQPVELIENLLLDEVNIKKLVIQKEKPQSQNFKNIDNLYLNTEITEALKHEGQSRELIRKIQDMRKEQGLLVTDRVAVTVLQEHAVLVDKFRSEILSKVLADSIEVGNVLKVVKI